MQITTQNIINEIKSIPRGKVSSYQDIATRAGLVNGARQTVRVLHSMTQKHNLPWHRVIRSDGYIALPDDGKAMQISLLKSEGVEVSENGKIDMKKYRW
jgi:methylated-DNA-protein-cysteine methyltransferase-like protein